MGLKAQYSGALDLVDQAENLRRGGRRQEALEIVERCLNKNPKHPRGLLLQSRILFQAGMVAQALRCLGSLEEIMGQDEGLLKITRGLEGMWQEPKPQMDPAFVTETMAELHIRQGYLWEAMEIYQQLYLASAPEGLWQKVICLRDRLENERDTRKDGKDERVETLNRWIEDRQKET